MRVESSPCLFVFLHGYLTFVDKMDALHKVYDISRECDAQGFNVAPLTLVVTPPPVGPIMYVTARASRFLLTMAIPLLGILL